MPLAIPLVNDKLKPRSTVNADIKHGLRRQWRKHPKIILSKEEKKRGNLLEEVAESPCEA